MKVTTSMLVRQQDRSACVEDAISALAGAVTTVATTDSRPQDLGVVAIAETREAVPRVAAGQESLRYPIPGAQGQLPRDVGLAVGRKLPTDDTAAKHAVGWCQAA